MLPLVLLSMLAVFSCTEQSRARSFGGKMTITLPPGEKLLSATWKGSDLFYLTEPMDSAYTPTIKKFVENSSFGMIEGEITFIETR